MTRLKMKLLICALTISLLQVAVNCEGDCSANATNLKASGKRHDNKVECMEDPCNASSMVIKDVASCPGHCFVSQGNCYLKMLPPKLGVDARLFGLGGNQFGNNGLLPAGLLPPFGPNTQCPRFPSNCGLSPFSLDWNSLATPPVNIPYCQRIPCSTSDQTLDSNQNACYATPGCYFDQELHAYRLSFGYAALPGVPVCHKVVRNARFHTLVNKYLQTSNQQWNVAFTNCMIQQNLDQIHEQPAGCYMVSVFLYMGIRPKTAGWRGISKTDCSLIGACFDQTMGCFHPSEVNQVTVRSGDDPQRRMIPSNGNMFGQPLCQPFDINWPAEKFLDAYHSCRQSGCVVDPIVSEGVIKENLYNITMTKVPQHLRYRFWMKVQQNQISADNWRFELSKLKRQSPNSGPLSQLTSNPFNLLAFTLAMRNNPSSNSAGRSFTPSQPPTSATTNTEGQSRFGFSGNPNQFPPNFGGGFPNFPGSPLTNPNYPNMGAGFPLPPITNPFTQFQNLPGLGFQPQCPFYNLGYSGFPQLTGSFEGCCERNLCYIPRNQIVYQRSGVSPYLSLWENWSKCSRSCGGGVRTRTRRCVSYKHSDDCADETPDETESCGNEPCPFFAPWGQWGSCSHSCGSNGNEVRERRCLPDGQGCAGTKRENRPCNRGACPTLSSWSRFSECNATCGVGSKERRRTCQSSSAFSCDSVTEPLTESRRCEVFCGKPVRIATSRCDTYTCTMTETWVCEYTGNTPYCSDFSPTRVVNCCYGK